MKSLHISKGFVQLADFEVVNCMKREVKIVPEAMVHKDCVQGCVGPKPNKLTILLIWIFTYFSKISC